MISRKHLFGSFSIYNIVTISNCLWMFLCIGSLVLVKIHPTLVSPYCHSRLSSCLWSFSSCSNRHDDKDYTRVRLRQHLKNNNVMVFSDYKVTYFYCRKFGKDESIWKTGHSHSHHPKARSIKFWCISLQVFSCLFM